MKSRLFFLIFVLIAAGEASANEPSLDVPREAKVEVGFFEFMGVAKRFYRTVRETNPVSIVERGEPQGLVLQEIKPENALSKFGLRSGDVLTRIGKVDIRVYPDIRRAVKSMSLFDSEPILIEFLRAGVFYRRELVVSLI